MKSLRADIRWQTIRPYFDQCAKYWQANGKPSTILIESKEAAKTPGPVFLWLHGSYSNPNPRYSERSLLIQRAVERLNRPLVAVSGPVIFGPAKFNWSEKPERDFERVMDAVKEVSGRLHSPAQSVIAIGLSQGAQVALEIAARHPERFAGAIAIAPGAQDEKYLERLAATPLLKERGFVIITGDQDPGARYVGAIDAIRLKRAGANVLSKNYPNLGHAVPSDAPERLAEWVRFIQKNRTPIRKAND